METVAAERARVATEGWGAQILALQSEDGHWTAPSGWRPELPQDTETCWSRSTPSLVMKDPGLDPASEASRRMIDRLEKRLVFKPLNSRPFLHGEAEPCINGRILGIGSYFKEPNDALADQLVSEQLDDGGWNCKAPKSRRSSFLSTICVLEGLLDYKQAGGKSASPWLRFAFPTFWHYDVLRGLEYFRNAGFRPDGRVAEAVETVIRRRHQNGRWPLNVLHPEPLPVNMETAVGSASRWNTLRALRVLRWYYASTQQA